MVLEIAGGILLAFIIMGLLEDYPKIVNFIWIAVGCLAVVCFWKYLEPAIIAFACLVLFGFFRYIYLQYKKK